MLPDKVAQGRKFISGATSVADLVSWTVAFPRFAARHSLSVLVTFVGLAPSDSSIGVRLDLPVGACFALLVWGVALPTSLPTGLGTP